MVEETGQPEEKKKKKNLICAKFHSNGATYLVLRAGIEPTPRTDIFGYRLVSQMQ
jgi:hypothetical protein